MKTAREKETPAPTSAAETTASNLGKLLQFPGPADDKERAAVARTAARMLLTLADEKARRHKGIITSI
jgi:hypothetical protein